MAWIGIDFGTYNSSAAIKSRDGAIEVVKCSDVSNAAHPFLKGEKRKEFPSFISFDESGAISDVGLTSKEMSYSASGSVVWGVKRLLGKTYSELKETGELDRFPYRIRPDRKNGQCLIVVREQSYTPVQLCSEIFKKIKKTAEKQAGEPINSLIVSIPAYYDPVRVTPIVEAARLAGFVHDHIKTIPEPVAAALAAEIDVSVRPIKGLVFDLGAGTLDVTTGFLYRQPDQPDDFRFQVMKNTGDPKLGGIDMDDRLAWAIQEQHKLSDLSPEEFATLRRAAESAKISLSEEEQIKVEFEVHGQTISHRVDQFQLRQALEGAGPERDLLEVCRQQVMAAIDGAGWTPQEIELLIMIGGPTRLRCIQDIFKIIFHNNPAVLQRIEGFYAGSEEVDRMTAVSIGAVMSVERQLDDKVPYGHGIEITEVGDDEMEYKPKILVPPDSPYPFKSEQYQLPWINKTGLFEFKIIQQVPESEAKQSGYEYRFIGTQKFAVKNPDNCLVAIQMGYNDNKELEVSIRNMNSIEAETYVGLNQFNSIGMDYRPVPKDQTSAAGIRAGSESDIPEVSRQVKRPPDIGESGAVRKQPPSNETLDKFAKWVQQGVLIFARRKIENHPVPQMLLSQQLDEIERLLQRGNLSTDYHTIFTKVNSLLWNCNSRGLLNQNEYRELNDHLSGYESDLFRIG